ncbi:MAG: restriction endonuclease subunit S [Candidatus Accumulibacter sp.]|nr:restriction endonuclease subunit S [Candidatus Accumulibacter necessarius]
MQWETPRVGEICGCIVPGRNKPQLFDGDIPWITMPDLEDGKPVTGSRLGFCISRSEAKAVGSKVVPPGSVLMSCAGELGIVALTQNEIVVNQQLHVFLPSERVDAKFLLNALAYQKDRITSLGTKTAVPYLNKGSCNSIPVPLPPFHEQRAIAEALSDVDALLGALDRLIAKKRDLKQAAMQQLLTGQTRLPGFHGDWEVRRLGEVASLSKGTQLRSSELDQSGVFAHLNGGITASGYTNKSNTPANTIAISEGGNSCGFVQFMREPYWCGGHCYSVIPDEIDNRFLYHALKGQQSAIMALRVGSGLPNVQKSALLDFDVNYPVDPNEQRAIAAALGEMYSELEKLEQRHDKTRALKQAMMQELLTGKTRLV